MSWHDGSCELDTSRVTTCLTCGAWGDVRAMHCHCGSRGLHLCAGCKRGLHLDHSAIADVFGVNHNCQCDLCVDEAA